MKKEYIQPSVMSVDVETSCIMADSNKNQYTIPASGGDPTPYVPGGSEDAAASYRSSLWGE